MPSPGGAPSWNSVLELLPQTSDDGHHCASGGADRHQCAASQVRCVMLLAQPPRRRPWSTRCSPPVDRRTQNRALDADLDRLGVQLDKAGWPSQRLRDLELHDPVEETVGSAPTAARRHAVAPTRRHTAGRRRA